MWVNSIFTDRGKGLSQALDDRGDEKVASQLDEVIIRLIGKRT
jgi:hypothetical protein